MRKIIIIAAFLSLVIAGTLNSAYGTYYGASGDGMSCGLNKSQG